MKIGDRKLCLSGSIAKRQDLFLSEKVDLLPSPVHKKLEWLDEATIKQYILQRFMTNQRIEFDTNQHKPLPRSTHFNPDATKASELYVLDKYGVHPEYQRNKYPKVIPTPPASFNLISAIYLPDLKTGNLRSKIIRGLSYLTQQTSDANKPDFEKLTQILESSLATLRPAHYFPLKYRFRLDEAKSYREMQYDDVAKELAMPDPEYAHLKVTEALCLLRDPHCTWQLSQFLDRYSK